MTDFTFINLQFTKDREQKCRFATSDPSDNRNFVPCLKLEADVTNQTLALVPSDVDIFELYAASLGLNRAPTVHARFIGRCDHLLDPLLDDSKVIERFDRPIRKVNTEVENVTEERQGAEYFSEFKARSVNHQKEKRAENHPTVEVDGAANVFDVAIEAEFLELRQTFLPNFILEKGLQTLDLDLSNPLQDIGQVLDPLI